MSSSAEMQGITICRLLEKYSSAVLGRAAYIWTMKYGALLREHRALLWEYRVCLSGYRSLLRIVSHHLKMCLRSRALRK